MELTNHALKRCRKRFGLPRKSIRRTAEKALSEGRARGEFKGRFKRYLDAIFLKDRTANNMRIYGQNLYIFKGETLITAWTIPTKYHNNLANN